MEGGSNDEVIDMRYRLGFVLVALAGATAQAAFAQESDTGETETAPPGTMLAPKRALEIGVEGGYTQPLGMVNQSVNINDIAKAGGSVALDLAYRMNPFFSVGAFGEFNLTVASTTTLGDGAVVRGAATGLQAGVHFTPYNRVDPYMTIGTGYRFLWETPSVGFTQLMHGFEAARARVGLDFRATKDLAIGPMIGADLNVFVWDRSAQDGVNEVIHDRSVNTYLFAGIGGKFDVGGKRVPEYHMVQAVPAAGPPIARSVQTVAPPVVMTPPETPPETPSVPLSTGVSIDDTILAQCHIAHPKAFFEFDKSNLSACDLTTIDEVAACFATGPLAGRKLDVVGHADPRGSDDYNLKLGESRADSVSRYLERGGVSGKDISTESVGKREATGVDENGWAYDRRVELHLVK